MAFLGADVTLDLLSRCFLWQSVDVSTHVFTFWNDMRRVSLLLSNLLAYHHREDLLQSGICGDKLFRFSGPIRPPVIVLEGDAAIKVDGVVAMAFRRRDLFHDWIMGCTDVSGYATSARINDATSITWRNECHGCVYTCEGRIKMEQLSRAALGLI